MADGIRIIPLGGLGEVGKNMLCVEYGGDVVVIDAGVMFPKADMHGVDLVLPDMSWLVENADRVRAVRQEGEGLLFAQGEDADERDFELGARPFLHAGREPARAAQRIEQPAQRRGRPLDLAEQGGRLLHLGDIGV